MNKAQKRTWLCFAISLVTLLIATVVITFIWVNEIDVIDIKTKSPAAFRIYSLILTVPLILIVIISAQFPRKYYDERDKLIERKATIIGAVGVFIFLTGAIFFFYLISRVGSIRTLSIVWLVYLAAFVWFFISSVAALIQYRIGAKMGLS
ncbi:MAG TPA: hypothetical protein VMW91_10185 [Desulfosporosinus sp.]|nr:hypothetical protein [Desulfosporosinus sp.]